MENTALKDTKEQDQAFTDIQARVLGFIQHAENHERYTEQRDRAILCSEFEIGHQWTEEEYARWKDVGIEPVTMNRCLTTVKTLAGMYISNMQDITVVPRKGGSETGARVMGEIIKHAQDVGGYELAAFTAFNLGNIQTESFIDLEIENARTENGQLNFQASGFFDIIVDPDCQTYDIDAFEGGAKYVIKKKYIDFDDLEELYNEIERYAEKGSDGFENYTAAVTDKTQFSESTSKKYRECVFIVYWKESEPATIITELSTGKKKLFRGSEGKKLAKRVKKSTEYTAEKAVVHALHRSVVISEKLIEDKKNPFGENVDFFLTTRYVPIFRPDYMRGILDDITSINREENVRRTQVARLLNLTTNSGWVAGSTTDKAALNELKQFGSIPGFVADKSKFGNFLEKITPNQLSQGHMQLAQQSNEDVKEITGLNSANRGDDKGTNNDPGIVLQLKKEQGITANEGLFKNFRWTLEILGNKVLKLLDALDIYSQDEIRAIVSESHLIDQTMMQKAHDQIFAQIGVTLKPPQPMMSPLPELMQEAANNPDIFNQIQAGIEGNQMYMEQYPQLKAQQDMAVKEMAIRMLLDSLSGGDLTQYGIKVILNPSTPTARAQAFSMIMAVQDKYGIIPPDILLEYSDLPNKDEIIARIRASMAAGPMMGQLAPATGQGGQGKTVQGIPKQNNMSPQQPRKSA